MSISADGGVPTATELEAFWQAVADVDEFFADRIGFRLPTDLQLEDHLSEGNPIDGVDFAWVGAATYWIDMLELSLDSIAQTVVRLKEALPNYSAAAFLAAREEHPAPVRGGQDG